MKRRRPKFVQHMPTAVTPMFTVLDEKPGENFWHAKIADAIAGDQPEFRYYPPKKGCPFTVQELANRVAGELNEARGTVLLQEFINNIPTFMAMFVSNSRQVFCVRSSDESRAQPVDLSAAFAWLKARGAK